MSKGSPRRGPLIPPQPVCGASPRELSPAAPDVRCHLPAGHVWIERHEATLLIRRDLQPESITLHWHTPQEDRNARTDSTS